MRLVLLPGWSFNTSPFLQGDFFTPNLYEYEEPLTFANIARQLYAELKLHTGEITLVGWSMGGSIALELLSKFPDLPVRKLVLISSTAKFVNSTDYSCGVSPVVARQLRQRIVKDVKQGLSFFQSLLDCAQDGTPLALPEGAVVDDKDKLLRTLDELYLADYRQILSEITIPTTIVHGAQDLVCPVAGGRYLAEHIPHAELAILEGQGHLLLGREDCAPTLFHLHHIQNLFRSHII